MTSPFASIPASRAIRAELESLMFKDLLGPADGPTEEVTEQTVRDRYLVGMLAPTQQNLEPEEFEELADGQSATPEEGSADYTGPTARTLFPSSFGLTFSLDLAATALSAINPSRNFQPIS